MMNQQHNATSLARVLVASIVSVVFTSCWWDDSPTAPVRAPRNTFADYQHIGGLVNGVWTKEHNPYIITGETYIKDGDSLIIEAGVEIVVQTAIYLDKDCKISFHGVHDLPIRFVQNSTVLGGGIFGGMGVFRAEYTVFEGHGKTISIGTNVHVKHCVFSEIMLGFSNYYPNEYDSMVVRDCIFAGYRPWDSRLGGAQFSTWDVYSLDSSKTRIENNLFFTGIGDSTWVMNPPAVVNALLKGQNGTSRIKATKWPGSGNLFANPKWVKYNYVGPSPAGISDNDYRLQSGSPAIGAASDGTNIGVY